MEGHRVSEDESIACHFIQFALTWQGSYVRLFHAKLVNLRRLQVLQYTEADDTSKLIVETTATRTIQSLSIDWRAAWLCLFRKTRVGSGALPTRSPVWCTLYPVEFRTWRAKFRGTYQPVRRCTFLPPKLLSPADGTFDATVCFPCSHLSVSQASLDSFGVVGVGAYGRGEKRRRVVAMYSRRWLFSCRVEDTAKEGMIALCKWGLHGFSRKHIKKLLSTKEEKPSRGRGTGVGHVSDREFSRFLMSGWLDSCRGRATCRRLVVKVFLKCGANCWVGMWEHGYSGWVMLSSRRGNRAFERPTKFRRREWWEGERSLVCSIGININTCRFYQYLFLQQDRFLKINWVHARDGDTTWLSLRVANAWSHIGTVTYLFRCLYAVAARDESYRSGEFSARLSTYFLGKCHLEEMLIWRIITCI